MLASNSQLITVLHCLMEMRIFFMRTSVVFAYRGSMDHCLTFFSVMRVAIATRCIPRRVWRRCVGMVAVRWCIVCSILLLIGPVYLRWMRLGSRRWTIWRSELLLIWRSRWLLRIFGRLWRTRFAEYRVHLMSGGLPQLYLLDELCEAFIRE